MPKDEWGVKRLCPSCTTRFYDLKKDPMACPSCGAVFSLESLTAPKPKAPRPEKVKPAEVVEEADVVIEDNSDDDDDADDSLLEDDDDDVDLEEIADVSAKDSDN